MKYFIDNQIEFYQTNLMSKDHNNLVRSQNSSNNGQEYLIEKLPLPLLIGGLTKLNIPLSLLQQSIHTIASPCYGYLFPYFPMRIKHIAP